MLNYHFRVFNGCLFGEFPNQAQPWILPPLDCVGLSVAHHHHHQRTIPEDVLMFQLLSSSGQIHNSYAFHSPPKFCLCDARCATLASSLLFMWSSSIGDESCIGDIIYHVHLHVLSSFVDLNSHSWSIPKFHLSSLWPHIVTLLPKVSTFGFSLPSICGLVFEPTRPQDCHRIWRCFRRS